MVRGNLELNRSSCRTNAGGADPKTRDDGSLPPSSLLVESILIHPSITSNNALCFFLPSSRISVKWMSQEINDLSVIACHAPDGIAVAVLLKRTTHGQESPAVVGSSTRRGLDALKIKRVGLLPQSA